jgi:hypothetical protein
MPKLEDEFVFVRFDDSSLFLEILNLILKDSDI